MRYPFFCKLLCLLFFLQFTINAKTSNLSLGAGWHMMGLPVETNTNLSELSSYGFSNQVDQICTQISGDFWCASPNFSVNGEWDLEEFSGDQGYLIKLGASVSPQFTYTTATMDWLSLPPGYSIQYNRTGTTLQESDWEGKNSRLKAIWLYRENSWYSWQVGAPSSRITSGFLERFSIQNVRPLTTIGPLEAFWTLHENQWLPKKNSAQTLKIDAPTTSQSFQLTTGILSGMTITANGIERTIHSTFSMSTTSPTSRNIAFTLETYPLHPEGYTFNLPIENEVASRLNSNASRLQVMELEESSGNLRFIQVNQVNNGIEFRASSGTFVITERQYFPPIMARVSQVSPGDIRSDTTDIRRAKGRVAVIVHGLDGTPEQFSGNSSIISFALSATKSSTKVYDEVWFFRYPSGFDLGLNAQQLKDELVKNSSVDYHIYSHSKGGLVARYALEVIGGIENVSHMIVIASPHEGIASVSLALSVGIYPLSRVITDLALQSPFVSTLKSNPLKSTSRYLFLGGDVGTGTDGSVETSSALSSRNESNLKRILFYNSSESNADLNAYHFGHTGLIDYFNDSEATQFLNRVEEATGAQTLIMTNNSNLSEKVLDWLNL